MPDGSVLVVRIDPLAGDRCSAEHSSAASRRGRRSIARRTETRAKIHKIASFATLPLFAAELWLGQSIYNTPSDSKKSAHIVVGTGIIGLFGVNTVTGAWNLFGEGWHEPQGRDAAPRSRFAHDGGRCSDLSPRPMSGPGGRNRTGATFDANKATHRTIALTSIGLGTAGYLLMLFGNR